MLIVGAVLSITISLFAPKEPGFPGAGRVRVASNVPARFFMVPRFNARAVSEA